MVASSSTTKIFGPRCGRSSVMRRPFFSVRALYLFGTRPALLHDRRQCALTRHNRKTMVRPRVPYAICIRRDGKDDQTIPEPAVRALETACHKRQQKCGEVQAMAHAELFEAVDIVEQ